MGGPNWGPYGDVLVLGTAAVVLTWIGQAWIVGGISLAMTIGVAVAALVERRGHSR